MDSLEVALVVRRRNTQKTHPRRHLLRSGKKPHASSIFPCSLEDSSNDYSLHKSQDWRGATYLHTVPFHFLAFGDPSFVAKIGGILSSLVIQRTSVRGKRLKVVSCFQTVTKETDLHYRDNREMIRGRDSVDLKNASPRNRVATVSPFDTTATLLVPIFVKIVAADFVRRNTFLILVARAVVAVADNEYWAGKTVFVNFVRMPVFPFFVATRELSFPFHLLEKIDVEHLAPGSFGRRLALLTVPMTFVVRCMVE